MVTKRTDNRGVSSAIVRQLESLGYIVKFFRVNGVVEIRAVAKDGSFEIARSNDGNTATAENSSIRDLERR
jgi:hypothetical protein